jgi:hypothetical protein
MRAARTTFPPSRQWVSRKLPRRPLTPGAPARRRSLGISWVCDVGDPIMMGWVGVHDPSGLLKKLLQPGSARAADVPANAAAAQPRTTAKANPGRIAKAALHSRPIDGTLRFHCETHATVPPAGGLWPARAGFFLFECQTARRTRLRHLTARMRLSYPTKPSEEGAGNAGCVSAPAALRAKIKST